MSKSEVGPSTSSLYESLISINAVVSVSDLGSGSMFEALAHSITARDRDAKFPRASASGDEELIKVNSRGAINRGAMFPERAQRYLIVALKIYSND